MRIARLRQIVTVINERRYYEQKQKRRLVSWQTRNLAQFIAVTIEMVEGAENAVLATASRLALDPDELLEIDGVQEDEPATNSPGSYEKLMQGFRGRGG